MAVTKGITISVRLSQAEYDAVTAHVASLSLGGLHPPVKVASWLRWVIHREIKFER